LKNDLEEWLENQKKGKKEGWRGKNHIRHHYAWTGLQRNTKKKITLTSSWLKVSRERELIVFKSSGLFQGQAVDGKGGEKRKKEG